MPTFNRRRRQTVLEQARGQALPVVIMAVLLVLGLVARYFGWLQ